MDNGSPVIYYSIEMKQGLFANDSQYIEIGSGNVTSWTVTGVSVDDEYVFRVCAVNDVGVGPFSNSTAANTNGTY